MSEYEIKVFVSLAAPHFINGIIKQGRKLSINVVDEGILPEADYAGSVSGSKTDKPVLFEFPTYEYLRTEDVLGKCLSFKENAEE